MFDRGFISFSDDGELLISPVAERSEIAKLGVPTARYGRFTEVDKAKAFLDTLEAPYVLKADGLAAGKGVVIAPTLDEAKAALAGRPAGDLAGLAQRRFDQRERFMLVVPPQFIGTMPPDPSSGTAAQSPPGSPATLSVARECCLGHF